jgi:hypothetical protein
MAFARDLRRATCVATAVLALAAGAGPAAAQTAPPIQEPQLRIEAGQHTAVIRRISVAANGLMLATASEDKTVRIWSLPDGRLARILRVPVGAGNDGKLYAVALSPDGRIAAVGGWDAAYSFGRSIYIYLLDTVTGGVIRRLGPLPGAVNHMAFSHDGRRLAAGVGGAGSVRVFDTATWAQIAEDKDYKDLIFGLDFDAGGRLAASSFDGAIRIYDNRMSRLQKFTVPGGGKPYGVAFSPDGRHLAVGYLDRMRVDVLSTANWTALPPPTAAGLQGQDITSVTWSADSKWLFGSGRQYTRVGDGWRTPVLRWGDAGRGPREVFPAGPRDLISDMKPWGRSGVAYGTGDPALGLVDANGRVVMQRGPVTADLSELRGPNFLLSADARRIRIGVRSAANEAWLVDATAPSFTPSPQPPRDMHQPDVASLAVTDWRNSTAPKLGGAGLTLEPYETSFSVAVLPKRDGFIMGTHFNLRRFDDAGQEQWKRHIPAVAWGVNTSKDGRIVVAGYGDGTIRWHRASDGQELLSFFAHMEPDDPKAEKRWVMWTPKGYYTASPGGEELIGWHVNRTWDDAPDFFPADRFRNQFNRPDIVGLVLETLDEEAAIQRANAGSRRTREAEDIRKRQPPVVTVTSPLDGSTFQGQRVTMEYSVRSPSGLPIRRVWALVDGRETETAKGLVPVAPAARTESKGNLVVDLPPRDVRVAILAETDEGLASVPAEVRLTWGGAPAAPAIASGRSASEPGRALPRLFALAIGVSDYKDKSVPALQFAAKDARDVAAALRSQKGKLYEDVEVRVLTDKEATSNEIRKGLGWIATKPAQGDVAILFLSGHGVTDETGDYQFLPHDTEMDASAPIWLPVEGTALPHSDFTRALKRAQRAHTFFLFDTCHAGDVTGARRKGRPSYSKFVNELASAETSVRVLASSEGREVSLEDDRWQNGAFTKALVEGLSGAADLYQPKDGVVTADELALFVKRRVQELTRDRQHPVTQFPGMVRDIPLAALH